MDSSSAAMDGGSQPSSARIGLGVTWLTIFLPAATRGDFLRATERFGTEVIRGAAGPN
jgi:hypothetical protein